MEMWKYGKLWKNYAPKDETGVISSYLVFSSCLKKSAYKVGQKLSRPDFYLVPFLLCLFNSFF